MSNQKIEHAWIEQEAPSIIDLLRNVAAFGNRNFEVSSHVDLVDAIKEWRDEARRILNA